MWGYQEISLIDAFLEAISVPHVPFHVVFD